MFESAELGHVVGKAQYDREVPRLRAALLEAQLRVLDRAEFPVILLSAGVDGAGRGDVVNLLLEWMDPRHIRAHAMGDPSEEERAHPPMWRFWRALAPSGRMAVFFGSWYTAPIAERVRGTMHGAELTRSLLEITRFERMLVDEGALVVKVWLHLTKKNQRKRFEHLGASPATAWRVTKEDWKNHERYNRLREVCEQVLTETSTAEAPWTVVEATDPHSRNLTVARTLLTAMESRLKAGKRRALVRAAPPPLPPVDSRDVVTELDLRKSLTQAAYKRRLPKLQGRLNALARHKRFDRIGVVALFEGVDAAGKGGAIRRVTRGLDARRYEVVPIAAPSEEERAHPYLWRFWRHVPRRGRFALFDRSWYGRVLVERVDGLAAEPDWMRAYREIVDFEEALTRFGLVVVKFWLAVSKKEQLARFRARERTAFKRYKLTAEDWRNRRKWDAYERAVCDMVDRTSTERAPWHLIEAEDKKWARVRVLETLCGSIEEALEKV
jgi:AMP-polyphosphate phosphotransferase